MGWEVIVCGAPGLGPPIRSVPGRPYNTTSFGKHPEEFLTKPTSNETRCGCNTGLDKNSVPRISMSRGGTKCKITVRKRTSRHDTLPGVRCHVVSSSFSSSINGNPYTTGSSMLQRHSNRASDPDHKHNGTALYKHYKIERFDDGRKRFARACYIRGTLLTPRLRSFHFMRIDSHKINVLEISDVDLVRRKVLVVPRLFDCEGYCDEPSNLLTKPALVY